MDWSSWTCVSLPGTCQLRFEPFISESSVTCKEDCRDVHSKAHSWSAGVFSVCMKYHEVPCRQWPMGRTQGGTCTLCPRLFSLSPIARSVFSVTLDSTIDSWSTKPSHSYRWFNAIAPIRFYYSHTPFNWVSREVITLFIFLTLIHLSYSSLSPSLTRLLLHQQHLLLPLNLDFTIWQMIHVTIGHRWCFFVFNILYPSLTGYHGWPFVLQPLIYPHPHPHSRPHPHPHVPC